MVSIDIQICPIYQYGALVNHLSRLASTCTTKAIDKRIFLFTQKKIKKGFSKIHILLMLSKALKIGSLVHVIFHIIDLSRCFDKIKFSHIVKNYNETAHLLAKFNFFLTPPIMSGWISIWIRCLIWFCSFCAFNF